MIKKVLFRLLIAVAASTAIGVGSHVTTYSANGDLGVYYAGLGAERSSEGDFYVWLCDSQGSLSWQCPADDPRWVPATPTWVPVPLDIIVAVAADTGREDWTGCEISYGDTSVIRCPDGFRLES